VSSSIVEVARQRGLPQLAEAMQQYEKKGWIGEARAVTTQGNLDKPVDLLSTIARHGLRSDLLESLANQLADRPLERGLLAWDVMNSCLFEQHAGVEPWRDWATAIATQLPPNGRRGYPAAFISAREVVASITAPEQHAAADDERLLAGMMAHELGAYAAFKKGHPEDLDFLVDEKLLPTTLQIARLFSLAHLPTLASFYQEYLRTEFGLAEADEDVCETLLDCASPDFVPANDRRSSEFALYVEFRKMAVGDHALRAKGLLAAAPSCDAESESRGGLGRVLLRADLDVMFGGAGDDLPVVHAIVKKQPLWRFARRVQARVAARRFARATEVPESMFDQFVETFGSDATFWYSMLVETAHKDQSWLRSVIGRLTSELLTNPHDVEGWRALAMFLDDAQTPTLAEIGARVADQTLLG
jgi:hypothetical protein